MAGKLNLGNNPLPDGHPFKGNVILFGSQIPPSWKEHLRKLKADREAGQDTAEKQLPKEDAKDFKDN